MQPGKREDWGFFGAELIFEREQLNALANLSMRARAEGRSIVYLPSCSDQRNVDERRPGALIGWGVYSP